ncbi:MAG: hypothetical protein ABFS30_10945, partial [Pseudomonadota bacterium]
MSLKQEIEARIAETTKWEIRRQYADKGPNMRRLWVLACMDERLPVDEALGIKADSPVGGGDAHLFRNAGGIVTDDAIRSAMLTINFFGTSADMLEGKGTGDTRRCAACHVGGGLIMKELDAPWLHWEGDTTTPG